MNNDTRAGMRGSGGKSVTQLYKPVHTALVICVASQIQVSVTRSPPRGLLLVLWLLPHPRSQPAPGLAQEQLTLRQSGVCSIPASIPGLCASLAARQESISVRGSRLPQQHQDASSCPGHSQHHGDTAHLRTVPQASQPGLTPVQIQSGESLPRHLLPLSN